MPTESDRHSFLQYVAIPCCYSVPPQNRNEFTVRNPADFSTKKSNIDLKEDETMVSFDVASLFTAISVEKACNYIRKKLNHLTT